MTEQRYKAVQAVIAEGRTVTQVARDWNVCRQTLHEWLGRYEDEGLEGLADRSHRPEHCPHQMSAEVEAKLLELRRARPYLGARRLAIELGRNGVVPAPSKSAVQRSLVRAGLTDPERKLRRLKVWKRWERAMPMEQHWLRHARMIDGRDNRRESLTALFGSVPSAGLNHREHLASWSHEIERMARVLNLADPSAPDGSDQRGRVWASS